MIPPCIYCFGLHLSFSHRFVDTMVNICGQRQTSLCTMKGLMLTTDEAFKIGMVDEVVPADQVETRAQEEIKSWLKIPGWIISHFIRNLAIL